jgi:hypothetical protein
MVKINTFKPKVERRHKFPRRANSSGSLFAAGGDTALAPPEST